MVRVKDGRQLDALALKTEAYIEQNFPQVNQRIKRIQFGSASDSAIALRVIGPDPEVLRHIGSQLDAIFWRMARRSRCATTGRNAAK